MSRKNPSANDVVLETFLGGMETRGPRAPPPMPPRLETFLGGMETKVEQWAQRHDICLETFLGGMETAGQVDSPQLDLLP